MPNRLSSGSFVFITKIHLLRPDWFDREKFERAAKARREVLELAKSGAPRPSRLSKDPHERQLAYALNMHNYDLNTYPWWQEIYAIRPDWFDPDIKNRVAENKRRLLEIARSGGKRPSKKSKDPETRRLGSAIEVCTAKYQQSYDEAFDKEIRTLRPDWFDPDRNTRLADMREKFLQLARSGAPRPKERAVDPEERKMGQLLRRVIKKFPEFAEEMRRARPEWFR